MKMLLFATALGFAPAPVPAQAAPPAPSAAPAASPAPAATPPTAAAPLPDADPALWVVRDADTIIYLFGTFHLLDGRPWFNDEVKTAFDASNELVLEAILPDDPASLAPIIARYAVDQTGRRLSDRLTAEQNAALNAAIAPLGVPAGAFDRFEPWFVSMTLTVAAAQRLGVGAADGPEAVLMRAARARNVAIGELEGVQWQFLLFDGLPYPQQVALLVDTLEHNDELDEELAPMLAAWSTGDVERLVALIDAGSEQDPALHRLLFAGRNANWASWIQLRLRRPGTVFLAVGAGHLAGSDSVQAQLARRGFRAERVPHVEAN